MALPKNIFENLSNIDTSSYLLDPSVAVEQESNIPKKNADITTIEIRKLHSFKNHPFHVDTDDDSFKQLVESIAENGVIYPIIVRPIIGMEEQYEIIAGHCRVEACKQLGLPTIPAKIQDMDDFLATVIMTHSNISGRERISISEKAKAYRMCMEQEKHQGMSKGEETAAVIGAGKDSTRQVYRLVRLSYLIPEFLDLIDNGRIALQIGNELAYISEDGQKALYRFCSEFKTYPNLEQAKELRQMDSNETLSYERVISYLAQPTEKKKVTKVTFKTKDLSGYFDENMNVDDMTTVIIKLLEKYKAGEYRV